MACINPTVPPLPPLPLPFAIPPLPIPPFPAQPQLCCQLPDIVAMIAAQLPPIPLPPGTLNPAEVQIVVAAVQEALATVQLYIDGLIPPCPKITIED
jgi:hypothetical protein